MTKRLTKLLSLALVVVMLASTFAACTPPQPETPEPPYEGLLDIPNPYKQAQYNTTTTVMPSNWNELNYSDNNDTQILSYISSSFFEYDFVFENGERFTEDGHINVDGMVPGAYTTTFSAATKLEDVTASVDAKWGYTADQKAEGGYAWRITLRQDLKWHDGTPIKAEDFIYSMKAQLDPTFMNFRANLYYDTLRMKNARAYFYQNQEFIYETVGSLGYTSNQAALDAGEKLFIDVYALNNAVDFGVDLKTLTDADGNPIPQYLSIEDTTNYGGVDGTYFWSLIGPGGQLGSYAEPGTDYSWVFIGVENQSRDVAWDTVGIYADGEYSFVICLNKSFEFLREDGSLSYLAAYNLSSLPLVKKDLYESCKKEPVEGSTLWTTNYNSSLATTASWGPYMLSQFEGGSHYKLVKNPNWFGWKLGQYQNQYNVSSIYCRKIEEVNTQWMGFLAGEFDDSSLDTHNQEYLNSKYVHYVASTGTFGMQLYSNLGVLKNSGNNNGILAIQEFRHAFNLSIDRSDVIENIWPGTAAPCFGLMSGEYYYDIEHSAELADGGRYRNNPMAKAGILRAYGYTQAADGTWSINDLEGMDLDEAYETLTGYNPTLAKEKLKEAIEILEADAEYYGYDSTKEITLVYGSSADTDKQRFRANYLQGVLDTLSEGTKLEGKIKVVFDASAGSQWAEAFRSGATQIGFGYGFSGNALNPFDIVGSFVNPDDDLNYHQYWDTSSIDLTLTMPAGDYAGAGETHTMSLQNWYYCLNGLAAEEEQAKTFDWGAGKAPAEARLMILSALEEAAIKESRSVMLISDAGGSFLGAKFSYAVEEDNVFMGYGGLRYIVVNYTDEEWTAYVASQGNDLSTEYKKSE